MCMGGGMAGESANKRTPEAVAAMRDGGMTIDAIAQHFGVHRSTIQRDLKKRADHAAPVSAGSMQRRAKVRLAKGKRTRLTTDNPGGWRSAFGQAIIPPPDYGSAWQAITIDTPAFARMSPKELVNALVDLAPDVSRALWDFNRMFNAGHEVVAYNVDTDSDTPNKQAQTAIDEFINALTDRYGSIDVLMARISNSIFLRGALFAELVLDQRGRTPIDLAVIDPISARFKLVDDDLYGESWQLGQWQGTEWIALDQPTIRYVPLDPLPGSPYGRPIVAPAIFTSLFLLGLFHDLRRVIAQQGYPRNDISIDTEKVIQLMGEDTDRADEVSAAIQDLVNQVTETIGNLEPDDAYVHPDTINFNPPVGTVGANALSGIDAIIEALERQLVKSLKSTRLLMGTGETTSEAEANRNWEVYIAGIKSVQHLAEQVLGYLLTLALEVQGIAARVEIRFAEVRASEELRDAQTLQLKLQNADEAERLGYMEHDEASTYAVGHEAVEDRPEPPVVTPPQDPNGPKGAQDPAGNVDGTENSDPKQAQGDDRSIVQRSTGPLTVREVEKFVPPAGSMPTMSVPDQVLIGQADRDAAMAVWDHEVPEYPGLLGAVLAA